MTTLRERVLGGETTFGTWLSTGSPVAAEIAGQAGFDWLAIDTEHGMSTEATLLASSTRSGRPRRPRSSASSGATACGSRERSTLGPAGSSSRGSSPPPTSPRR